MTQTSIGPTVEHAGNTNTCVATKTQSTLKANAAMDNMDDATFTIVSQNTSPPLTQTRQKFIVVERVTNLEVVDVVVDTVLKLALGDSFPHLP